MSEVTKKHVFLSYCHENEVSVGELREELVVSGEQVWWDQDIFPGEVLKDAIHQAMMESYAVVVCLSQEMQSRDRTAMYPEILDAIAAYRELRPGSIFLILVRLSECEIPSIPIDASRYLSAIRYVDLFPPDRRQAGVQRLLAAIRKSRGCFSPEAGAATDDISVATQTVRIAPGRLRDGVAIRLTLYVDQEGSPFHRYLLGQVRALCAAFGSNIEANLYGPDEYERALRALTAAPMHHRTDCHVVALDEFWLEKLIEDEALEDIGTLMKDVVGGPEKDDYGRGIYVSAAHDMVMYNRARDREKKGQEFNATSWYAVPARNNCGVLCCDPLLVGEVIANEGDDLKGSVEHWLKREKGAKFGWRELMRLKEPFHEKRKRHPERYPGTFFSFCRDQMESCVSFLLELALSYARQGAMVGEGRLRFRDDSVVDPDKRWARHFFDAAIGTLFTLLDYPDIARIAAGVFRLPDQEPPSLFTRQWISTLGCLRAAGEKAAGAEYSLRLEPFELPVGPDRDHPTPVSGTWYVGVLKGSVAVEAGARIVSQFTSIADEVFKLNNYIGLPVRNTFYESDSPIPFVLPYKRKFVEIAKVHKKVVKTFKQNDQYEKTVKESKGLAKTQRGSTRASGRSRRNPSPAEMSPAQARRVPPPRARRQSNRRKGSPSLMVPLRRPPPLEALSRSEIGHLANEPRAIAPSRLVPSARSRPLCRTARATTIVRVRRQCS